jgi:hypothetical protein
MGSGYSPDRQHGHVAIARALMVHSIVAHLQPRPSMRCHERDGEEASMDHRLVLAIARIFKQRNECAND